MAHQKAQRNWTNKLKRRADGTDPLADVKPMPKTLRKAVDKISLAISNRTENGVVTPEEADGIVKKIVESPDTKHNRFRDFFNPLEKDAGWHESLGLDAESAKNIRDAVARAKTDADMKKWFSQVDTAVKKAKDGKLTATDAVPLYGKISEGLEKAQRMGLAESAKRLREAAEVIRPVAEAVTQGDVAKFNYSTKGRKLNNRLGGTDKRGGKTVSLDTRDGTVDVGTDGRTLDDVVDEIAGSSHDNRSLMPGESYGKGFTGEERDASAGPVENNNGGGANSAGVSRNNDGGDSAVGNRRIQLETKNGKVNVVWRNEMGDVVRRAPLDMLEKAAAKDPDIKDLVEKLKQGEQIRAAKSAASDLPGAWTPETQKPLKRVVHVLRNVVTVGGKKLKVLYADRPEKVENGADAELRQMRAEKSLEGNGPKGEARPSNPPSQNKSDAPAESIALKTLDSIPQGVARVKQARKKIGEMLTEHDGGKGVGIDDLIQRLASRLKALPVGQRSRYRTYALDFATEDGQTFTLRLSDHSAHATAFLKHGSNGDFNISVVVNRRGEDAALRDTADDVVLTQYTYRKEDFQKPEDVRKLLGSVKTLFDTGKYTDLTGKAEVSVSGQTRKSVSGVYTGSAADYANRSRQGGVDDGPSVKKIGTGEGAQVYGWGLYGSTERGVAEGYAKDAREYNAEKNGKRIDLIFPTNMLEAETAKRLMENDGDVRKTIEKLKRKGIGSAIIKELEEHGSEYSVGAKHEQLYEQTFFTNRAEGDESHLLKWYEPVSKETWDVIRETERRNGTLYNDNGIMLALDQGYAVERDGKPFYPNATSETLYKDLAIRLGSPKAASEFLYRAGIDGVKYPVDSYGKTAKDGDKAGWNYVAFSDEHIRVDHKWTDGEKRYMKNAEGVTVGEYDTAKGEIRLYPGATVADVVHEFTHPLMDYARAEAKAGRGEFLGKIKEIIDAERATWDKPVRDAYKDKGEEEILEEIFTHAMGEKGEKLFGKSINTLEGRQWYRRLWEAIKGVWQDFATKMGWNKADLRGLERMSPEDAAQKILSEMAKGRNFGDASVGGEGMRNAFVGGVGAERLGIGKRGTVGTFIEGSGRKSREVINTVFTDCNAKETQRLKESLTPPAGRVRNNPTSQAVSAAPAGTTEALKSSSEPTMDSVPQPSAGSQGGAENLSPVRESRYVRLPPPPSAPVPYNGRIH